MQILAEYENPQIQFGLSVIAQVLTRKELATSLGLTPEALRKWERDYKAPLEDWLAWPIDDAKRLAKEWRQETFGGKSNKDLKDIQDARLKAAQATEKEIEVEILLGKLVPRDQVIEEFADFLGFAKPLAEAFVETFASEAPEELRISAREHARHYVTMFLRKLETWNPLPPDGT